MPRTASVLRLTTPFLPVGAALFLIQLDFFSLNLALPTIAADLGETATNLQWLISAYMIALGALLIPAGRLGDILGRRDALLAGLAVFGVCSLACGLLSDADLLIAFRAVQGLGAALIFPNAFALVTNATAETVRPRIFGVLLAFAGVGTALGPVVGGVFAATVGWRWVFLINVPVTIVAYLGALRLPNSRLDDRPRTPRGLDWWGTVTGVAGLALLSVAVDDAPQQGYTSWATLLPLVAGVACFVAFALVEARVREPLVDWSLLRIRPYDVLLVAGTVANVGTCVFIYSATLDLQELRGLGATTAGLLFVFSSAGLALCGPLAGWLTTRFPAALVMAVAVLACPR